MSNAIATPPSAGCSHTVKNCKAAHTRHRVCDAVTSHDDDALCVSLHGVSHARKQRGSRFIESFSRSKQGPCAARSSGSNTPVVRVEHRRRRKRATELL